MKKILFTILAFCLSFIVPARAQHYIAEATYPATITKTIVRDCQYPVSISYIETLVSHYFAWSDGTTLVHNARIDNSLFVRDMYVFDSIVYFCGVDNSLATARGFWGWFRIRDLLNANSNLPYHVYNSFTGGAYIVDSLHSLVAFSYGDDMHVAVVGSCTNGSNGTACVLDISSSSPTAASWNYILGVTDCYPTREVLTKVCLTDNYVVVCGSSMITCESYRFHLRSGMFSGTENMRYHMPSVLTWYNGNQYQYDHGSYDLAITHVEGDTFASVTRLYNNPSYSPLNNGFLVNVLDIPTMLSAPSGIPPAYSATVEFPNISIFQIQDIRYNNHNISYVPELAVLMQGYFPSLGTGSLVAELPFPYSMANYSFLSGRTLLSLDNYNSQNHFIVQGYDLGSPNRLNTFVQPAASSPLCAASSNQRAIGLTYWSKTDPEPYSTFRNSLVCIGKEAFKTDLNYNVPCYQP